MHFLGSISGAHCLKLTPFLFFPFLIWLHFLFISFGKEETAGKEKVAKALGLDLKAAQLKPFSCGEIMQKVNSEFL